MCFNAFDQAADLDVLDHPVLNFIYYLVNLGLWMLNAFYLCRIHYVVPLYFVLFFFCSEQCATSLLEARLFTCFSICTVGWDRTFLSSTLHSEEAAPKTRDHAVPSYPLKGPRKKRKNLVKFRQVGYRRKRKVGNEVHRGPLRNMPEGFWVVFVSVLKVGKCV